MGLFANILEKLGLKKPAATTTPAAPAKTVARAPIHAPHPRTSILRHPLLR
jgi:hypothetical protein